MTEIRRRAAGGSARAATTEAAQVRNEERGAAAVAPQTTERRVGLEGSTTSLDHAGLVAAICATNRFSWVTPEGKYAKEFCSLQAAVSTLLTMRERKASRSRDPRFTSPIASVSVTEVHMGAHRVTPLEEDGSVLRPTIVWDGRKGAFTVE